MPRVRWSASADMTGVEAVCGVGGCARKGNGKDKARGKWRVGSGDGCDPMPLPYGSVTLFRRLLSNITRPISALRYPTHFLSFIQLLSSTPIMLVAHNQVHDSSSNMDQQEPPEFILDVFTDPRSVRDVVKGWFLSPDGHSTLYEAPRYPLTTSTTLCVTRRIYHD